MDVAPPALAWWRRMVRRLPNKRLKLPGARVGRIAFPRLQARSAGQLPCACSRCARSFSASPYTATTLPNQAEHDVGTGARAPAPLPVLQPLPSSATCHGAVPSPHQPLSVLLGRPRTLRSIGDLRTRPPRIGCDSAFRAFGVMVWQLSNKRLKLAPRVGD